MKRPTEPVQAHMYDSEYFLRHRGGGAEFLASQGKELYDGHRFALELAELRPTDRVLDVGCGCGEITLNAARYAHSVVGVDYAADAIDVARIIEPNHSGFQTSTNSVVIQFQENSSGNDCAGIFIIAQPSR